MYLEQYCCPANQNGRYKEKEKNNQAATIVRVGRKSCITNLKYNYYRNISKLEHTKKPAASYCCRVQTYQQNIIATHKRVFKAKKTQQIS
jgi:hypothetical protein